MRLCERGTRRRVTVMLLALIGTAAVFAQGAGLPPAEAGAMDRLNNSPRHGEWISYDAPGGGKVDAWVVYPERSGPAPVVVVVHEIFGLSDWIRAVADQFAAEGFIAIAPDFLSGKAPGGGGSKGLTVDAARAINSTLDPAEVAKRIDGAVAYATSLPAATKKFGVVGFCWGGGISFSYATYRPDLSASAVFYGVAPSPDALARIQAPVEAFYGGSDARVTSTAQPAADALKRLGKSFDYAVYDGAGHGFLRQQDGQNGANLEATKKAWPKVVEFFKAKLDSGTASAPSTSQLVTLGLGVASAGVADDCTDDCCALDSPASFAMTQ